MSTTLIKRLSPLTFASLAFICVLSYGQTKSKGPEAVSQQEPNRIVATMGGTPLTAKQAMDMLSTVPPPVRNQRQAQLPKLVQQLYMQRKVAEEAIIMHLDKQSPWKEKLYRARVTIYENHTNYASQPEKDTPPVIVAQWHNARDKILWDAYFAQATTKEAKEALHQQERDKYKIEVRDPDFFNGQTN